MVAFVYLLLPEDDTPDDGPARGVLATAILFRRAVIMPMCTAYPAEITAGTCLPTLCETKVNVGLTNAAKVCEEQLNGFIQFEN